MIAAGCVTVTPAAAFGIPAALAVIVADPTATPITGTATLVVFAPKFTLAGAVATLVLLELRLIVRPLADAGTDRINERFWVPVPLIVRLPGEKLIVVFVGPPEVTCTCPLAGENPLATADIIADPMLAPVTTGARLGADAFCGINIFSGATVAFDGSLLLNVMNTPPAGAAVPNVTGNGPDWPGGTVIFAGRMIPDSAEDTVTLAVVTPKFGVLAVIVAEPAPTPVTGTLTLVPNAPNVTTAGTVATPGLVEVKLAVSPPAGAGPDRFRVIFCVKPGVVAKLAGEKKLLPPPVTTCTCPLPDV